MKHQLGFTLIELLVVIAIIAILATVTMVTLGNSRVKARNSAAQNDVTQAGKSIELFKDSTNDNIISLIDKGGLPIENIDTLDGNVNNNIEPNQTLDDIFKGVQNIEAGSYSYSLLFSKTPSTEYVYKYNAPVLPDRQLISIDGSCYLFYSTIIKNENSYFTIRNGETFESTEEPGCE